LGTNDAEPMNWKTETDLSALLSSVKDNESSQRRARLFACACCRRLWDLLQTDPARQIVELAEAYADGAVSAAELQTANDSALFGDIDDRYRGLAEPRLSIRAMDAILAVRRLVSPTFDTPTAVTVAIFTSKDPASDYFLPLDWAGMAAGVPPSDVERTEQVKILRDIFGNPFRPVSFNPEWRTPTVLNLANQMYKSRDFSAMPILADALEDACCDNEEILGHCRGEGPHVRGCWVVDKILGKE
jgi:hypothetical protein